MDTNNNRMSTGKVTIPASSFNQRTDMNIEPSTINTTAGGVPQQWLNTAPISKRDMKTGDTPLESKTKEYKAMTFDEFINSND